MSSRATQTVVERTDLSVLVVLRMAPVAGIGVRLSERRQFVRPGERRSRVLFANLVVRVQPLLNRRRRSARVASVAARRRRLRGGRNGRRVGRRRVDRSEGEVRRSGGGEGEGGVVRYCVPVVMRTLEMMGVPVVLAAMMLVLGDLDDLATVVGASALRARRLVREDRRRRQRREAEDGSELEGEHVELYGDDDGRRKDAGRRGCRRLPKRVTVYE